MRPMIGMAMSTMLLAFSGCDFLVMAGGPIIQGNGVIKTESREVPAFSGVDISSTFEATVTIGEKPSVSLSLDENLLPLVQTKVKDSRLIVTYSSGQNIRTSHAAKVSIVVPSVNYLAARGASKLIASSIVNASLEIESEGASTVDVKGLSADAFDLRVSGASRITIAGSGKRLMVDVSGASKLFGGEASFESAEVDVSGASQAEIDVTASIKGQVSGASKLTVRGKPVGRSVTTSGASSVSY